MEYNQNLLPLVYSRLSELSPYRFSLACCENSHGSLSLTLELLALLPVRSHHGDIVCRSDR